jgi:transcriptional regulator with XRE-family HTH domain
MQLERGFKMKILNQPKSVLSADIFAGKQLRKKREELCLTQNELAGLIGVTYQQVQKYESGYNRISAGRLMHLAHILDVSINYFFSVKNPEDIENSSPESLELLGECKALTSSQLKLLITYAKALGKSGEGV